MKKTKKYEKPKEAAEDRTKELTETLQRLQAEFENYKKRMEKEKQEFCDYAKQDLIKKLLQVLDNFELAFKHDTKDFHKGIELIYAELTTILRNEGLKPIIALNQRFDAFRHEALLTEKSNKEEGLILEEMQKGYLFKDKVIRHSKVKVSKK